MSTLPTSSATAFDRLLEGHQAVLARAITVLEGGGPEADALAARLYEHSGRANVIAVTGPPGAGKSTLINALVTALRRSGNAVAILAVDPSSPLSGGAVLGDRTRMGEHSDDRHVFIRSIASRGHLGGLSLTVPAILDAVDAAGWPTIILETVGAGQSETEVAEFADVKIVVNAPGLGDDVQAIKAGILEIADILVVNKSDLPLADRTVAQLRAMLELRESSHRDVPIVSTVATRQEGLGDLGAAIEEILDRSKKQSSEQRTAKRLSGALKRHAEAKFQDYVRTLDPAYIDGLCLKIRSGGLSIMEAADEMMSQRFSNGVEG